MRLVTVEHGFRFAARCPSTILTDSVIPHENPIDRNAVGCARSSIINQMLHLINPTRHRKSRYSSRVKSLPRIQLVDNELVTPADCEPLSDLFGERSSTGCIQ